MAKEAYKTWPELATGSAPLGFTGETFADHQALVFLWDPSPGRRALIRNIVAETAHNALVSEGENLGLTEPLSGAALLLVALGAHQARDDGIFRLIARSRAQGAVVIAYEDAVDQWPVGRKCLPLLAGAARLLDIAADGIPDELPDD